MGTSQYLLLRLYGEFPERSLVLDIVSLWTDEVGQQRTLEFGLSRPNLGFFFDQNDSDGLGSFS